MLICAAARSFSSPLASDGTSDQQLEVAVRGKIGGVASRFVAYHSLAISQMHCLGLETFSNPVFSSLQHKCPVLGVELQTF